MEQQVDLRVGVEEVEQVLELNIQEERGLKVEMVELETQVVRHIT